MKTSKKAEQREQEEERSTYFTSTEWRCKSVPLVSSRALKTPILATNQGSPRRPLARDTVKVFASGVRPVTREFFIVPYLHKLNQPFRVKTYSIKKYPCAVWAKMIQIRHRTYSFTCPNICIVVNWEWFVFENVLVRSYTFPCVRTINYTVIILPLIYMHLSLLWPQRNYPTPLVTFSSNSPTEVFTSIFTFFSGSIFDFFTEQIITTF